MGSVTGEGGSCEVANDEKERSGRLRRRHDDLQSENNRTPARNTQLRASKSGPENAMHAYGLITAGHWKLKTAPRN